MASVQEKPAAAAPAVPFSYAQAAKGFSSSSISVPASKPSSGSATPAKDVSSLPPLKSEMPAGSKWADDEELDVKDKESNSSATTAVDAQSSPSMRSPITHASTFPPGGIVSPPSPDFGTSSTSTLAREDDAASIPISSSESTWENKSQTSTVPEKALELSENDPPKGRKKSSAKKGEKGEKGEKKQTWPSLQEAPPPPVNIWQKRAEELKTKAPAKPVPTAQSANTGTSGASAKSARDKPNEATAATKNITSGPTESDKKANGEGEARSADRPNARNQGDDKFAQRRDPRGGSKASEKTERIPKAAPLPARDQSSWPTPDLIKDDGLRKPQDKQERVDNDRNEAAQAAGPKAKNAWVHLDFTPSVVFQTPLPNSNSRRGGRGSGRGGKEQGGRGGTSATAGTGEKGAAAQSSPANGEVPRRGRPDPSIRNASPFKGKRSSSDETASRRELRPTNGTKENVPNDVATGPDTHASKASADEESRQTTNPQYNTFPRQSNPSKPRQNRRNDIPFVNGEKRKDSDPGAMENDNVSSSRRTSITVHGEENSDRKGSTHSDAAGHKYPTIGRRGGEYSSFSNGDRMGRGGRGNGRGGRGGPHAFHNGGHQYTNGQLPPIPAYGLPRSPTGYQQDPYFPQQPQQPRMYPRQPNRAGSLPSDNSYGRLQNGYPAHQLPPLNTFLPQGGMYDYPGPGSMTAVPFAHPLIDTYSLLAMVSQQMEYYFSVDNLCKDVYLRRHMDSQGFVLLSVIAGFKRLKNLTTDLELIKYVCQNSANIEHLVGSDGQDRLRLRVGWEKWVNPMADRDPSAQHAGPSEVVMPPTPQPLAFDQTSQRQVSLPLPNSPTSAMSAPPYQSLNGFASSFGSFSQGQPQENPAYNGFQTSPTSANHDARASRSPESEHSASAPNVAGGPTNGAVDHEPDAFSDVQVGTLSVIVRTQDPKAPATSRPLADRTFSSGSLDGRNIAESLGAPINVSTAASPSGPTAAHESEAQRSPAPKDHFVPFLAGSRPAARRHLSRSGPSSDNLNTTEPTTNIFWVKDKHSPANELPAGASSEFYITLRATAFEQRSLATPPHCPYDMQVLYQFWSHFLIRNFNHRMYNEFCKLAAEDAERRKSTVGRANLLKYYSSALANQDPIRFVVARDYIELVKSEPADSDRPAFKQLRTAWRDGALNMKNRKRILDIVDTGLVAELDGKA